MLELPNKHASTSANKTGLTWMFQSEMWHYHFITSVYFLAVGTHERYGVFRGNAGRGVIYRTSGLRFYGRGGCCGRGFLDLTDRYRWSRLLYMLYSWGTVSCFLGLVLLSIFVCRGRNGNLVICTVLLFFASTCYFLMAEINNQVNDKVQNVTNYLPLSTWILFLDIGCCVLACI